MTAAKTLAKVKTRELAIGEPWEVMVRIKDLDMTETDWLSQLRNYPEADVILATPDIDAQMDDSDTLVFITLTAEQTADLEPGRASWGLKAERSLFWGELKILERVVR